MEDFIEDLYKKAYIVPCLKELVTYAYRQDGFYVQKIWKEVAPSLAEVCADYGRINAQNTDSNKLFKCVEEVVDAGVDISRIGSVVESEIIPLLESFFQAFAIDVKSEDGRYTIKSSSSGFLTLYDSKRGIYLHSTSDPVTEAKELARYIYKPEYSEMAILGVGLGYLPLELWKISHGAVKITVFENSDEILFYASHYGVLDLIPKEKLEIVKNNNPDESVKSFLGYFKCDCGKFSNWWYLNNSEQVKSEAARDELNLFLLRDSVSRRDTTLYGVNYWSNTRIVKKYAPMLKQERELCDEWVLVAGGPSVDDNLDFLKKCVGKCTVISVITCFSKLMSLWVKPDIVVASEMGGGVYRYFSDIMQEDVPMIIAPTLFWKCAVEYAGEKYLAPIVSNESMAIKLFNEGIHAWNSGYTVTVLTLESAIQLGAKKIYLVGADFAYPGGYSHANGTVFRKKIDESDGLFEVDSNDGGKVYTSEDLNMFRLEFERVLSTHKDCTVINYSKHGARIKGTIVGE